MKNILKQIPFAMALRRRYANWRAERSFPRSFESLPAEDKALLDQVIKHGYAVIPNYKSALWCAKCRDAIDSFISDHPDYTYTREDKRLFGAHNGVPLLQEYVNDPFLQKLSDTYYGKKTAIGVCMANRIEHTPNQALGSGGDWHRDREVRQFKTLLYLSDVNVADGPFQFVENSHTAQRQQYKQDVKKAQQKKRSHRMNQQEVDHVLRNQPERLKTFCAKAGTLVLVDTSGVHRGSPVQAGGKRYAVFNYYYPEQEVNPEKMAKHFSPMIPDNFSGKEND